MITVVAVDANPTGIQDVAGFRGDNHHRVRQGSAPALFQAEQADGRPRRPVAELRGKQLRERVVDIQDDRCPTPFRAQSGEA